jgi:hypothetical protein
LIAPAEPVLEAASPLVEPITPLAEATELLLDRTAPLIGAAEPLIAAVEPLTTAVTPIVSAVVEPAAEVAAAAAARVAGAIAPIVEPIVEPVVDLAAPVVNGAANGAAGVVTPVVDLTAPVVGAVAETAAEVVAPVIELAVPVVDELADAAAGVVKPVVDVAVSVVDVLLPAAGIPVVMNPNPGPPLQQPTTPASQQPSGPQLPPSARGLSTARPLFAGQANADVAPPALQSAFDDQYAPSFLTHGERVEPAAGSAAAPELSTFDRAAGLSRLAFAIPTFVESAGAVTFDNVSSQDVAGTGESSLLSLHTPGFPMTPRFDRFGTAAAVLPVWGVLFVFVWLLGGRYRQGQPRPSLQLIFIPPR